MGNMEEPHSEAWNKRIVWFSLKTKKENKLTCSQISGRTVQKNKEVVTELSSQKSRYWLSLGRNLRSEGTERAF